MLSIPFVRYLFEEESNDPWIIRSKNSAPFSHPRGYISNEARFSLSLNVRSKVKRCSWERFVITLIMQRDVEQHLFPPPLHFLKQLTTISIETGEE